MTPPGMDPTSMTPPGMDPTSMTPPGIDPTSMSPGRLESLLSRFAGLSVLVVGDFFLDKYLVLDPALDEPSLETGLAARQVVDRRCMPGAAGHGHGEPACPGCGKTPCPWRYGGRRGRVRTQAGAVGDRGPSRRPDRIAGPVHAHLHQAHEPRDGRREGIEPHRYTEPDAHATGTGRPADRIPGRNGAQDGRPGRPGSGGAAKRGGGYGPGPGSGRRPRQSLSR